MDTSSEKIGLKERYEAGSLVPLNEIGVTDLVQDFIFEVTHKEKELVTATYMANTLNKFMNGLAQAKDEAKEKPLVQVEKKTPIYKKTAGDHAGTLGTTEDMAARLISIMNELLGKARQTPIDVPRGDPAKTVAGLLKDNDSDIINFSFSSDVLKWMAAHPYATAFHITCVLLLLTPGLAIEPILMLVGFSRVGIIAGSVAARYMAMAGEIAARSLFACLQSAAMGGYGVWRVYAAVRSAIAAAQAFEIGRAKMREGQAFAPIMISSSEKGDLTGLTDRFYYDKNPLTEEGKDHGGCCVIQ